MRRVDGLAQRHRERLKREDRRAGGIIAALYNLNARQKETDPLLDWDDFFSEWKEPMKPQSDDDLYQTMLLWADATKGMTS